MANKLMDELSRELSKACEKGLIYYKYRIPNMQLNSKVIADFIVILNNGYTIYIECKKTEGKSVYINDKNNSKIHQILHNQFLQNKKHSKHIYILGFYKFKKKGFKKYLQYSRYYLISDINKLQHKYKIDEKLLSDNCFKSIDLNEMVREYFMLNSLL
jgi:Holliday junction resolvase